MSTTPRSTLAAMAAACALVGGVLAAPLPGEGDVGVGVVGVVGSLPVAGLLGGGDVGDGAKVDSGESARGDVAVAVGSRLPMAKPMSADTTTDHTNTVLAAR